MAAWIGSTGWRDGTLGIVDYKTGVAPSPAVVRAGFANQLGLCGWLLEQAEPGAEVSDFAYWTFQRRRDDWGSVASIADEGGKAQPIAAGRGGAPRQGRVRQVVGRLPQPGTAPFMAKLRPQWARGSDYDQLMRLAEWWGR